MKTVPETLADPWTAEEEDPKSPPPALLVADDDPDILRIVKFFLTKQNYNVFGATDGQEALDLLEQHPEIELILSDVKMPNVTGLELLQAVREDPRWAETPVILISAEGETSKKIQGLNLGADDFITKPFNFDELMARVRNHLRLRLLQKDLLLANDLLQRRNDTLVEELETARGVQMALLPDDFPQSSRLGFAARYLPVERLGGDLFDIVELGDSGKIGVLIVDVCGHGVPAALITAMTKVTFRNACFASEDPAQVLAAMNAELSANMTGGFITAFYGVFDVKAGTLAYASGGHPPLLVHRRAENRIFELEPQATFLGSFPKVGFRTDTFPLQKGDRVVFYTDGLFESQNPDGDPFGMEQVKTILTENGAGNAQALIENLIGRLDAFRGPAPLDDDITLVGVDVLT